MKFFVSDRHCRQKGDWEVRQRGGGGGAGQERGGGVADQLQHHQQGGGWGERGGGGDVISRNLTNHTLQPSMMDNAFSVMNVTTRVAQRNH